MIDQNEGKNEKLFNAVGLPTLNFWLIGTLSFVGKEGADWKS